MDPIIREAVNHWHLAELTTIMNGMVLIMVGWIGTSVRGIFKQLRTMNGRLGAMEEWRRGKEKLDDERHQQNERDHLSIRSVLEYLQRQAHALFGNGPNHEKKK